MGTPFEDAVDDAIELIDDALEMLDDDEDREEYLAAVESHVRARRNGLDA